MGSRLTWFLVLLLAIPPPALAGLCLPSMQLMLSGHPTSAGANPAAEHRFALGGTVGFFYVGAFANYSTDRLNLPNSGIRGTIQVVSQQVSGCLSYWVDDDSAANIWGQVGYQMCDGSTPVAFYQIWNLETSTVLVTGTAPVSQGNHSFSMYSINGSDTWAYALDASVIGTYGMSATISSTTYGVSAYAEEGYVTSAYQPARQVEFSAIQTYNSSAAVWSPVQLTYEPIACGATGMSCWGIQGNLQNSSIPAGGYVTGGTTPLVSWGTWLWNGSSTTSPAKPGLPGASDISGDPPANNTSVSCVSPITVGKSTICTASVTGNSPTGKVTWSTSGSGKFSSQTCKLRRGACSVKYTPTSADSQVNMTANYLGDKRNSASSGTLSLAVTMRASVAKVSCSRASLVAGSSRTVKCTAKVTGYSPTGTVSWTQSGNGSVSFSSATCTLLQGKCSVTITGSTSGQVVITATYMGDPNNQGGSRTAKLTIRDA